MLNYQEINDCGDRELAISAEQQQLFQRRLEEGYNLPDAEYMRWLRIHHPESLPPDGEAPLPNLPLDEWKIDDRQESLANGDRQESLANDDRQESLADLYSSVRPASPLTMTNGPEMEVAGVSMDETSAFPVSLPPGSGGTHDTTIPSLCILIITIMILQLQGSFWIARTYTTVNSIWVKRKYATSSESSNYYRWCHGSLPCFLQQLGKLIFCNHFTRIVLYILVTNILPVLFQRLEYAGI